MSNESSVLEFGFDESKVIKNTSVEKFTQNRHGEATRVAIISFKRYIDGIFAKKTREKGSPLTDQEKAELVNKVDAKLAEQLKKEVKSLTEADRLDIKEPRFAMSFTHYDEAVGTIRCLSKYQGSTCVERELCCDKFNDADQTVGVVIMTYPVGEHLQVEADIFKLKKMTNFYIWKLGSKKFKKVEATYVDARNAGNPVIDLKVTLDGDKKYQKQTIEILSGAAFWAREDTDPAVRHWILEQGLRLWKHVPQSALGFEMTKDKLLEKLGAASQSAAALSGGEASAALPKSVTSYDSLLD